MAKSINFPIQIPEYPSICNQNPYDIPLYRLVFRDPYFNSLLQSLYNWVGFHPLYKLNNQAEMVTAHVVSSFHPFVQYLQKNMGWDLVGNSPLK